MRLWLIKTAISAIETGDRLAWCAVAALAVVTEPIRDTIDRYYVKLKIARDLIEGNYLKHRDAKWQGRNLRDCARASGAMTPAEVEIWIRAYQITARRPKHPLHGLPDEWWDEVIQLAKS